MMLESEKYSQLSESELADRVSYGDELIFTEIYNRYWRKLLAIAYSHTKDKAMAEEIVQEVFVSFWNKKDIVHIQSLPRYLAKAVKFCIFKETQRRKRHTEIEQDSYVLPVVEFGDEVVEAIFLKEYLDKVIDELPRKCRVVFKYSRQSGMNIAQIAELMNISDKTVESHLTKALKSLRLSLAKYRILI